MDETDPICAGNRWTSSGSSAIRTEVRRLRRRHSPSRPSLVRSRV